MIGSSLLLLAAAAPTQLRLAIEASPTEVFLVHPGPDRALLAIRPSTGEGPTYLVLEPGACALLAVPEGLDTAGVVFDLATADGVAVHGATLFAKGDRARRSAVLFEPESSQYALVACESENSTDPTGGSTWNMTIGPPPRDIKTGAKGEVLLFPNGAYVPEPGFQPVGGYHSPF
ncbi:MAG: hypothetical protein ACREIU_15685 [Planctomycetota bacterium]